MAILHAQPGEIISVRPLGEQLPSSQTTALIKTAQFEVIRLVLPAGKVIPEHRTAGEITVQCLEGKVNFTTSGVVKLLTAGDLIYLSAKEPHAVEALEQTSLLVTIMFPKTE